MAPAHPHQEPAHHDPKNHAPAPSFTRKPGDGWIECRCGNKHWGLNGAAGLFLFRRDSVGQPAEVALQHRALWSHQGGTWAVPGGAIMDGESPSEAALREAHEEAGVSAQAVRIIGQHVLTHPDWSYTTVIAEQVSPQVLAPTDNESLAIEWAKFSDVTAGKIPLLPAFEAAVPALLRIVHEAE